MSKAAKRPRFALRLLFLVVALFAAIFAWRHAIEQRRGAEGEWQRMDLEYRLAREQRSRASILQLLGNPAEDSVSQMIAARLAGELPAIDLRIAAMQGALKKLMSPDDYQRLEWPLPANVNPLSAAELKLRDEILEDLRGSK